MMRTHLFQNLKFTTLKLHMKWIHPKATFKLNEEIEQLIENKKIKPRNHPGILKRKMIRLPEWTVEAISQSLDDVERIGLFRESKKLSHYLFSRRLPPEITELKNKYYSIEGKMLEKYINKLTPEEFQEKRILIKGKVKKKLKEHMFAWEPLEFNRYNSLMYMVARSAPEYAVLYSIFQEIKIRDPEFVPKTIFDFGSGVGSVLWAALSHWEENIKEYVGIDSSNDMNDLSEEIMKHSPIKVKGYFHRQYMPISNLKFDMITCAYSLMEMHDSKTRLEIIAKLWKKTNKYLVLVEQGSNAGFKVMNEARSFIKYVVDNLETKYEYFIFAPCPHENPCPRYNEEKKTPCNFVVQNAPLPWIHSSDSHYELYTYIVFKKGKRTENDNWYRLVRPTLARSNHVRCRTCTPDGKLEEIIFTKTKHGKLCYKCAKKSRWGDRLPLERIGCDVENVNIEASKINDTPETVEKSEEEEFESKKLEYENLEWRELEKREQNNEKQLSNGTLIKKENIGSDEVSEPKDKKDIVIASETPFVVLKDENL